MKIEYVLTGYDKFDVVIRAISRSRSGTFVGKNDKFTGDLVVIMSMHPGVFEAQQRLRKEGRPFLFLDHAYFQRGHDKQNYRVVPDGLYNSRIVEPDHSRVEKWGVKLRPWKEGGRYVLVLLPAPNVQKMLGGKDWLKRTANEQAARLKLPMVIKDKNEPGLAEKLSGAALVVSLASAADVEAACMGVPGVYSEYSPAYPLSGEKGDRTEWIGSLANQQFNIDELRAGFHWPVYGY